MASGAFSLAFNNDFDVYSGVLPSGLTPGRLYYYTNAFNKWQEVYIWNN
jgi:hypothetical protein